MKIKIFNYCSVERLNIFHLCRIIILLLNTSHYSVNPTTFKLFNDSYNLKYIML